ncbi:hypothetical protein ACFL1N_01165 [Thermodesulfobacteriota bacterium]
MFNYPYLVELLSPRRSSDKVEEFLDRFAERYQKVVDTGYGVTIPDNPMGQPRLGALESIELLYKSVGKEKDEKAKEYDPVINLEILHESYPESCIYLSMLSFKQDWREILR